MRPGQARDSPAKAHLTNTFAAMALAEYVGYASTYLGQNTPVRTKKKLGFGPIRAQSPWAFHGRQKDASCYYSQGR